MKIGKQVRRMLVLTAFAATLLAGIGIGANASGAVTRTLQATYMNIKLVVDGAPVTPKDAAGNAVEPFSCNGTTYLPVRAVGNALGKEVTWDGDTRTVYIGKVPGAEENWMTKLPPYQLYRATAYDGSDRKRTFEVAGNAQTKGVVLEASWDQTFALWNTNGEYSSMTFTIGHMGAQKYDTVLEVYLDSDYSTEYALKWDGAPQTITVDLHNAPNVKLVVNNRDAEGAWGIYDISFS